jgi:hypothetical protein
METKYNGKVVIFESPIKTILLFLTCVLLIVGQLLSDMRTENPFIFWSGTFLFGIGGLIGIIKFLDPRNIYVSPKSKLGKQLIAEKHQAELETLGDFSYNETGFCVDLNCEVEKYLWQEIKSIIAYKRDDYTVDTICLDIYFQNKSCLTITENTSGWYQFINYLGKNVLLNDDNWQVKIILPAFATNLTLLYDKQSRTLEEVKTEYLIK